MMTSVLVAPDGTTEYEAAHGTVTKHYYKWKAGRRPLTNPMATIFAWSGALRKRGELDGLTDPGGLRRPAGKKPASDTLNAGIMTRDLVGLVEPGLCRPGGGQRGLSRRHCLRGCEARVWKRPFYMDPHLYHGRPVRSTAPGVVADPIDRTKEEMGLLRSPRFFGIVYDRVDHSHADTIEACHEVEKVLGWPVCKNLFLCNRQKTQYYLLMLEGDKVFKTKDLSKQLGVARLSSPAPRIWRPCLASTPAR